MTKTESSPSNVPCAKVHVQIFAPATYLFYFSFNSGAPRPRHYDMATEVAKSIPPNNTRPIRELNHYPNLVATL